MPRIEDFDSDGEMSGVELEFEQTTPPPIVEKSFASKADLMSAMADEDISDYDFDEDSDDSDFEIYGKVKPLAEPRQSRSVADTNGDKSVDYEEPGQELGSRLMLVNEGGQTGNPQESKDELFNKLSEVQDSGEDNGEQSWLNPFEVGGSAEAEEDAAKEKGVLANAEDFGHEDDVSIKSEEDTESIHYGGEDGEEASTINVQASSEVTPSKALSATSPTHSRVGRHDASPWLAEAPPQIQIILSKWFGVHGRYPPPCAGWAAPQYMHVSTSGKTAIWLHTSGERMTPSMFQVPDLIDTQGLPTRRILVVQGPTKGPYIVAHTGGANLDGAPEGVCGGSRFRIWLGVDSTDADGFEPGRASVWKGFAHNLGSKSNSHKSLDQQLAKGLKPSGSHPAVPRGKIGTLADSIPEQLKSKLEAWMAKHGRSYPPCTSHFPDRLLHHSSTGATATWWHASGEQMKPQGYSVDSRASTASEASLKRIIVVQGPTRGPHIIRYYKSCSNSEAVAYRIWEGVNHGDDLGLELGCSVFKVLGNLSPTQEDIRRWQSGPVHTKGYKIDSVKSGRSHHTPAHWASKQDANLNNQTALRPRSSIAAPSQYVPSTVSEYRRPHYPHRPTVKRKRDDYDEADRESLLNSFMSPAAEKIPQPLSVSSPELEDHLKNSVVLLFFPQSGGAPRVRLLGRCDSVQKFFAQALAGDVFLDGGGPGTKVLALTFGGGQTKSRSLVEDDDQDFDDLITALKALDCWAMEDGFLQGSLTVEVRAK